MEIALRDDPSLPVVQDSDADSDSSCSDTSSSDDDDGHIAPVAPAPVLAPVRAASVASLRRGGGGASRGRGIARATPTVRRRPAVAPAVDREEYGRWMAALGGETVKAEIDRDANACKVLTSIMNKATGNGVDMGSLVSSLATVCTAALASRDGCGAALRLAALRTLRGFVPPLLGRPLARAMASLLRRRCMCCDDELPPLEAALSPDTPPDASDAFVCALCAGAETMPRAAVIRGTPRPPVPYFAGRTKDMQRADFVLKVHATAFAGMGSATPAAAVPAGSTGASSPMDALARKMQQDGSSVAAQITACGVPLAPDIVAALTEMCASLGSAYVEAVGALARRWAGAAAAEIEQQMRSENPPKRRKRDEPPTKAALVAALMKAKLRPNGLSQLTTSQCLSRLRLIAVHWKAVKAVLAAHSPSVAGFLATRQWLFVSQGHWGAASRGLRRWLLMDPRGGVTAAPVAGEEDDGDGEDGGAAAATAERPQECIPSCFQDALLKMERAAEHMAEMQAHEGTAEAMVLRALFDPGVSSKLGKAQEPQALPDILQLYTIAPRPKKQKQQSLPLPPPPLPSLP